MDLEQFITKMQKNKFRILNLAVYMLDLYHGINSIFMSKNKI